MTTIETILAEVERRVAERMPGILLDRGVIVHAKREWLTCDCSFCVAKRNATKEIANIGHRTAKIWLTKGSAIEAWSVEDAIWRARKAARLHHRNKLNTLKNG